MLWTSRWNRTGEHRKPRILYLADRNFLVDDPKDKTFAPFAFRAGPLLRSNEGFTIPADEFLDRHRLAATDFRDIVVRAGEDAVAVVDGDFMKVLHQKGFRRAAGRCTFIAVHGYRGVLSGSLRVAAVDFREPFDRNLLVRASLPITRLMIAVISGRVSSTGPKSG
jgi:hypothetical protein